MIKLKDIDVYLIAGQSNAVGCSDLSTLPEDFVPEVFDRVVIYQEGNFCPDFYAKPVRGVKLGMGCKTDQMGIEYGIAKYLQEHSENDCALIRYAMGGSNLYHDWMPRFLWEAEPRFIGQHGFSFKCWAETVENGLNCLMNEGCMPRIKALAWMQGESDAARSAERAGEYLKNLSDLVFSMRVQLRLPSLPVAVGEIATHAPAAPWSDEVRAAQKAFAESDKNAAFVSTKDIPVGRDGLHFDAPEAVRLGLRFGETLLSLAAGN
ncbi:MAG: hypothetical protein IJV00_09805 [Clostridia bacterium]|nr:hypothetical protein [Clostridia bacterium]